MIYGTKASKSPYLKDVEYKTFKTFISAWIYGKIFNMKHPYGLVVIRKFNI